MIALLANKIRIRVLQLENRRIIGRMFKEDNDTKSGDRAIQDKINKHNTFEIL